MIELLLLVGGDGYAGGGGVEVVFNDMILTMLFKCMPVT